MILDTLQQDIRVGFRVLLKEKTFCILAAIVLALGIGGVTTQFTVVNAFVLRGFSFPHPEQLMSVGLIDPQATAQQNNNGNGNIPSAQDYEDLKAGQQSFQLMAGYINGSTINVTYKNNPQRLTGGYVTEDFFRIVGVSPIMGRDFTADDNKPGAEKTTILVRTKILRLKKMCSGLACEGWHDVWMQVTTKSARPSSHEIDFLGRSGWDRNGRVCDITITPNQTLPNGADAVMIIPAEIACFEEVQPCSHVARDFALVLDHCLVGAYQIAFKYCIEEIGIVSATNGKAAFNINVVAS